MDILETIEARQAFNAQIDELDKKRKALDAEIEAALGIGTHNVGKYSVTVCDTTEDRFDSTTFRKENAELAAQYMKTGAKHIFRIVEVK